MRINKTDTHLKKNQKYTLDVYIFWRKIDFNAWRNKVMKTLPHSSFTKKTWLSFYDLNIFNAISSLPQLIVELQFFVFFFTFFL